MHDTSTLAEKLAGFTAQLIAEGCDDLAVSRAKTYALDTLAVTLGGAVAESSKRAVTGLTRFGSGGPSVVFGSGLRLSCGEAALANGTLAHALELDDDHRTGVLHPGAAVVPAAFAVAEASGASGREFLLGLIAGYEVACRLGEVFRGSLFRHGFHPTALCGALGAAAAGAVVLRLDAASATHALGIAGTQAAGLVEWRADGSWIKRLHPGRAAQSGVIAALLAADGFTGPATILEGAGGFFAAFGHDQDLDREAVTRDLGVDLRGMGTAIKPYPCCRFAHGAIDLALEAQGAVASVQDIAEIEVRLYRTDVLTYHPVPINAVDAQFNVPYHVACCLLQGSLGLKDFTETAIQRPEILALAAKVRVIEDDSLSALYPEAYHTILHIKSSDNQVRQFFSTCPSGDPEADRYTQDSGLFHREALTKTKALLSECGYGDRTERLIELTGSLDTLPDLLALSDLLGRK